MHICIVLLLLIYIAGVIGENVYASAGSLCMWAVGADVTAPAFNFETSVGTVAFWFGFICLVVLL